ncbi:MAG: cellulase family glycosylhydrolase [Armatimonadetes bacterium]|nr:cellulase family glycosylhydrolase [Armatimonadota bacterium]
MLRIGAVIAAMLALPGAGIAAPPVLSLSGNTLKDARGKTVRLRGVNIMGYEYSPQGDHVVATVSTALDWQGNVLRIPISQDYWMGYGADSKEYRKAIDSVIRKATARNCYVIIDLHWSDAGKWGENHGQHNMPDDNTAIAWANIATRYKNNPNVLLGIYNEPHDIEWSLWLNGGMVTNDKSTDGKLTGIDYHTPGIQSLINTVRRTGAGNIIVIGGIGYAGELTGVVKKPSEGGYRPFDPGVGGKKQPNPKQNILYDVHIYPFSYSDWDGRVTVAAKVGLPIFVGEFGCRPGDGDWDDRMIGWIEKNGYSAAAWCFYGGNNDPKKADNLDLLNSWDTLTPTAWHGVPVKNWLAKSAKSEK